MIIDEHHPDFLRAKVVDKDGNPMKHTIKSVDTHRHEYTRFERDSAGKVTGALEIIKVKKITWCWYSKTITIEEDAP